MTGVVVGWLVQMISKQVDDKGLVVWYDPEQAYGSVAAELTLAKTTVARYDGSYLKLRKEIDHLLERGQPPRLVVYVPLERTETHNALIELDCAGVIMQPRQQPPACNTRLSVVGRNALKPILGEDQVAEIERQVESGKLSLADLDSLAEQGIDISTGVLKLIFGTSNPQEVALAFLHSEQHDEEVGKQDAAKELRHLLQISFDIELPAAELKNFGHKYVDVPEHYLREYDRLLMGGIWAQLEIRHQSDEEQKGKRSPFWIDSLKPIQLATFNLAEYQACRKDSLSGMASIAMFGNTNQPVEVMVRSSHLFMPMPDVIREDMAFLDRIHFYIPGWEMIASDPLAPGSVYTSSVDDHGKVGMDNGARKALIPLENKRNFLEVSSDIVERVDPVFFSDPMTAAMKALGMK